MLLNDPRKELKLIMICAMLMAALSGGRITRAETPEKDSPTCEETLEACDLYVKALEDEREVLQDHIKDQDLEIARLTAQVAPTPWYWYILGGAAAAILGRELIK